MKKTLSMILAVVMALSVLSGISISAVAAEPVSLKFETSSGNSGKYLWEYGEYGKMLADENGDYYFHYGIEFNEGDKLIVTMSDNSVNTYIYNSNRGDFIGDDGVLYDWDYYDNQETEHWQLNNTYYFTISAFGLETDVPVQISRVFYPGGVKYVTNPGFERLVIEENTNGFWDIDNDGNYYFHYVIEDLFEEGTKFIFLIDGTGGEEGTTFTYEVVEEDEDWCYKAFLSKFGAELYVTCVDNQFKNHWGVGKRDAELFLHASFGQGIYKKIPIEIVKGSQETCWHEFDEWTNVNGHYTKGCVGCGYNIQLPFKDISAYDSYFDYLAYTSVFNNFISGTDPKEHIMFSPKTSMTRAMFVAVLYRMAGNPYENGNNPYSKNPFTDVNAESYYYNAACWALDNGITNQLTFKPNDNVTREQTARFLFAYAEANDLIEDDGYLDLDITDYPDYDKVHSWAAEPLQWANYNDMITGTQQGYINPQGATQRIHASRILYGFGAACNIGNFE